MKPKWQLSDILDLEFFLNQDQAEDKKENELQKRDRDIGIWASKSAAGNNSIKNDDYLLHTWLKVRRRQYSNEIQRPPGQLFAELLRICSFLFITGGFLAGSGMAWSFLTYSGIVPVNASMYIVLFVVSQVILLTIIPFSFLISRLRGRPWLPLTCDLLRSGILRLAGKIGRISSTGKSRQWFATLDGHLRRQKKVYGSLFTLPFFRIIQLLGIGFNLGVLAATLLKVTTTDIAFGWQSTLSRSAETIYQLVYTIALPWSWFLPAGTGYPNLAQIEGSHLILKEGIYYLASDALVSWWPFLCMAVLIYGLLPRVFLLSFSLMVERILLTRLRLDSAVHQQIIRRMRTPVIATKAETGRNEHPSPPSSQIQAISGQQEFKKKTPESSEEKRKGKIKKEGVLALIPEELYDDCQPEIFTDLVSECIGREINSYLMIDDKFESDVFIKNIKNKLDNDNTILFLQEAWQPPIEEFFTSLRKLREQTGEKVLITVCLIGRPVRETIFTPVREHEFGVWKKKLTGMGDPWLQCVCLVECE
jgi:hypothetical protein